MENWTVQELKLRIAICEMALQWLRSDDPTLKKAENALLVPGAIEQYTQELKELVEARNRKQAVAVGLGTAKITPKIIGG